MPVLATQTFLIACAGQQSTETSNGRSNYEGFRDMSEIWTAAGHA